MKRQLPERLGSPLRNKLDQILPFETLEKSYWKLTKELKASYRAPTQKTQKEIYIKKVISELSRVKTYTSFWIGKRNVDIFIPSICGQDRAGCKGIVIEVDGDIHDKEFKMKMDNTLAEQLLKLNIAVNSIANKDACNQRMKDDIKSLLNHRRQDFRGTKRTLRRVYLCTLYLNLKKNDFLKLFPNLTENNYPLVKNLYEKRSQTL